MKPIPVLHIIKTLNIGGAETNLLTLARSFNSGLFDIHVAYSGSGELEAPFRQAGIKLFRFSRQAHKLRSPASLMSVWRLVRYIQKQKIRLIHTHTFSAHVLGTAAAKLTGCKIIEHVHDSRYMDPREFALRGELNQQYRFIGYFKNLSDRVIVLTKQNHDFILSHNFHRPSRVFQIQNGIDVRSAKQLSEAQKVQLRNRFGLPIDTQIVLTTTRFSPEKNLDMLFEIAAQITRSQPQASFLIAGSGPEKEKFEHKVKAAGLEGRIKAIGFYPDVPQLLAFSDVFLLPSTIELHSIAVLEAMLHKVPVVISQNVGCHNEFIRHWHNGVLQDPFRQEGWAGAIGVLLQDGVLRRRIGQSGFETVVREFDIQNIVRKLESLYAECVH